MRSGHDRTCRLLANQTSSMISPQQRRDVSALLRNPNRLFTDLPGRITRATISIDMGDVKLIHFPPYWITQGEARHSKDGGGVTPMGRSHTSIQKHMCIPNGARSQERWHTLPLYRLQKANKVTTNDPYPMPRIQHLIDGLAGVQFIMMLVLTKEYWLGKSLRSHHQKRRPPLWSSLWNVSSQSYPLVSSVTRLSYKGWWMISLLTFLRLLLHI